MSSTFKSACQHFQIPPLTRAQGCNWLKPKMQTHATPPQEHHKVCVCVCVASSYSTVFCFTLSKHLKAPLPSTPASDAFLCHFFLNTHHLSINSPSVFPIYLTLTCTNTNMHALRSSKTHKRAIKCHVATATRPSEERHSRNDPRDHLWLPPSALPQPIMTSLSHLHGDRRLY